jgi:Flp pilus assembly protein TadD
MRTLADILKKATQLHQAGKLEQAARGYRRILKINPRNEDTLHRYGQLLARTGDHGAAKRMFELLTLVRTDSYKPWLLLGQSCEALGQFLDAANAYREVVRLQPAVPGIFSTLANVSIKAGRIEDAHKALVAGFEVVTTDIAAGASLSVH